MPGITRATLARRFDLSKPTISEIAQLLIDTSVVREDGTNKPTSKGRRPIRLRLNADAYHAVAIDLGGTNLRGALINLEGHITRRYSEPTRSHDLLKQMANLVSRLLADAGDASVLGIGVGAAGTVNQPSGKVINMPALGLRDVDIAGDLETRFDLPVMADNDVNLATAGELWLGTAHDERNVICISVGTGIGAGLILDGQLYHGSHNLVGEIGYFFHGQELPDAPYRAFGAMEHRASGWGIREQALKKLKGKSGSVLASKNGQLDARFVLESAAKGDLLATEIVRDAAFEIGVAVANIVSLLDLDVVVLTGGIMNSSEQLIPVIRDVVDYVAVPEARDKVRICSSNLAGDAVLIGAAWQVQERLLADAVANAKAGESQ